MRAGTALLRAVKAAYPEGVDRVSAEAYVVVMLHVDGSIATTNVYRTSNVPELDDMALAAAQDARYRPGLMNCVAYASGVIVRVPFASGKNKPTVEPASEACAESDALLGRLALPASRGTPRRGNDRGRVTVGVTVEPQTVLELRFL